LATIVVIVMVSAVTVDEFVAIVLWDCTSIQTSQQELGIEPRSF
jgi:hypothetical protein